MHTHSHTNAREQRVPCKNALDLSLLSALTSLNSSPHLMLCVLAGSHWGDRCDSSKTGGVRYSELASKHTRFCVYIVQKDGTCTCTPFHVKFARPNLAGAKDKVRHSLSHMFG
jgi:hypothetical protein